MLIKIKKFLMLIIVTAILLMITACNEKDKILEQRCVDLNEEISRLEEQKSALESEIVAAKENLGAAKYVVTFRIKQSHFTLDIGEHIKDSMNEIILEIPVDKEYYDNLSVGDTVNDDFRMGSLIMHGSFGNWKVTVENKEVL